MSAAPSSPRRFAALLIWLVAMIAGALVISRTHFSADLSAFLPADPDPSQRVLIEQLQSGVAARTLMIGIEGGDAAQRAAASRAMAAELRAGGLFDQVNNGDGGDWQSAGTWLFAHRYLLSPAVTPERFTASGLRDAFDDTLSLLGTPAGNLVKPLLERDPTGEIRALGENLIPSAAPRSDVGVWVSRSAPRAILVATTHAAGSDLDAQAVATQGVRNAFDKLAVPALRLQLSGAPLFATQSRQQIEHETKQLAAVGGIVIGALLLLAFASLRALLVAWLPVASGVVAGTAAVSLAFGNVHGLTLGFGSTLIGETVDYAIYYLIQARGAAVPGTGWQRWRDRNWPTVRLGLLTSVCGFAALVFSGFPGLRQLGVFSIAGLVAAAMATRYVLPVLVPDGASGRGLRRGMARIAGAIVQTLPRFRIAALALGVLAAGVLVWERGDMWRGDLGSMSPVPRAAQELDAELRADLGASDARTLVVAQGADAQAALRTVEAAGARLDPLIDQGVLAGYQSAAQLLPSVAVQRGRLASLPEPAVLKARLAEATEGSPLTAARLEPFVADVEAARRLAPLQRADLQGTPLAAIVDALMFERPGGGWSAVMALQPGAGFDAAKLQAALKGLPDVQIADIKHELDSLYARYLHEAFVQVMVGALAVVLLLASQLRSWRRLVAVCQPLVLAVLITLAGLVLAHAPLGILHLVGLLLVVAVGSNYALFFDQLSTTGLADEDTLASLLLANLTAVISFGLIALSGIPALSAIGRVVAPGALLALLLAAACAPRRVLPPGP